MMHFIGFSFARDLLTLTTLLLVHGIKWSFIKLVHGAKTGWGSVINIICTLDMFGATRTLPRATSLSNWVEKPQTVRWPKPLWSPWLDLWREEKIQPFLQPSTDEDCMTLIKCLFFKVHTLKQNNNLMFQLCWALTICSQMHQIQDIWAVLFSGAVHKKRRKKPEHHIQAQSGI